LNVISEKLPIPALRSLIVRGRVPQSSLTERVPVLIDGGIDDDGAWALLPFYRGSPPAEHHNVPSSVLAALAESTRISPIDDTSTG
jgi:hypothetical protein